MKSFFKWSAVTAGILLAVGLICVFVSTLLGGRRALISVGDGLKNVEWDELDEVLESVEGLEFNIGEGGLNISVGDGDLARLNVNGITIAAGEEAKNFAASEIKKLDLNLGAGEFIIREKSADDGQIDVLISGVGNCNYYVEDGTLVMDGFNKSFGISNTAISEVILEIPADMSFEEVDAEVGAGVMDITGLQAQVVEASIGAGELNLESIKANEFSVKIGAGQLNAEEMDILNAEIEVSMGECIYEGLIKGNLEAECDMGNLELKLSGSQSEHNYQIECAAGNIDMKGFSVAGFAAEKNIDNGADSEYDISCNMGNITVEFEED